MTDALKEKNHPPIVTSGSPNMPVVMEGLAQVQDGLRKMGGDAAALADNELVFPSEESLKNLHSFGPLSDKDEEALDAAFSKVQGN